MNKKQIKYNFSNRNEKIKYIVIHDTGNGNIGANALAHYNYFNGGDRGASANIFVDDTNILEIIDCDKYAAWHCGDGYGRYGITNGNSIGIELCINSDGDYNKAFSNLVKITKELMIKYKINSSNVVRHYDASRKKCPASMSKNNWEKWLEFKSLIKEENKVESNKSEEIKEKKYTPINVGKYLNLKPHMNKWGIYKKDSEPINKNVFAYLKPKQFGGLSYKIIANTQKDVYTIETKDYGKVNIYAPRDNDSTITEKAVYGSNYSNTKNTVISNSSIEYLNLNPHMERWAVYKTNVVPVKGNQCGYLAPKRYGGLSYKILGKPRKNVYTIETTSFGKVNIYAPRDKDSSITNKKIY